MYVEPLEAVGLFPLAGQETAEPGHEKSERDLPFEFKPGVDYFAQFDRMLPAWQKIPYREMVGSEAALSDPQKGDSNGPAHLRLGPRSTKVVSHRRYVRAIDPAGNLKQLIVATCRPSPAYATGWDGTNTLARVVSDKSRKGWLIVERDAATWNPYSGRTDQQYAAWALAVMEHRKARHAAYEKQESEAYMSRAVREANERSREQVEAMKGMGTEIGREVAKAVLEAKNEQPAKRGKGE